MTAQRCCWASVTSRDLGSAWDRFVFGFQRQWGSTNSVSSLVVYGPPGSGKSWQLHKYAAVADNVHYQFMDCRGRDRGHDHGMNTIVSTLRTRADKGVRSILILDDARVSHVHRIVDAWNHIVAHEARVGHCSLALFVVTSSLDMSMERTSGAVCLRPPLPTSAGLQDVLGMLGGGAEESVARAHLCMAGASVGSVLHPLALQPSVDLACSHAPWAWRRCTSQDFDAFLHLLHLSAHVNRDWIKDVRRFGVCRVPWEQGMRPIKWHMHRVDRAVVGKLCDAGLLVMDTCMHARYGPVYVARPYMMLKAILPASEWQSLCEKMEARDFS